MLLVDVLPIRSPRYRGIRPVERNPLTRADERPVIPVLPDIDRIPNVLLVPAALDVVARVVLEQLRSRRRRPSIHGKRALVARDVDDERRRLVATLDLALIGHGSRAAARVLRDVKIVLG